MTNYLILGGSGFLGEHLSRALLTQGASVTVFSRSKPRTNGVKWIKGDMHEIDMHINLLDSIDCVYHLAWSTVPVIAQENPLDDLHANVASTLKLLELLTVSQVKSFVFASSGGTVYGEPQHLPIPEDHPTHPVGIYGVSKLAVENYSLAYSHAHGFKTYIMRIANIFGRTGQNHRAQGAVDIFLDRALSGRPIEIWGDGSVVRDFVYIDDVVDAFVRVKDIDHEQGIFNIGSGTGYDLKNIILTIEHLVGNRVKVIYMNKYAGVQSNVLDVERAYQVFGWQPQTSLEEGLQKMLKDLAIAA